MAMTEQGTVGWLEGCAERHAEAYCGPSSPYAWPAYDEDLLPGDLTPTDFLAPALLSYPIPTRLLNEMFRRHAHGPVNEYGVLFDRLRNVVSDEAASNLAFDALGEGDLQDAATPGWSAVLGALDAVQRCGNLTSVVVTKILHRKRPNLVPINDSLIQSFYGLLNPGYSEVFRAIHEDLHSNWAWLDDLRSNFATPAGRPMTRLRALDIIVWMHKRTECPGR